MLLNEFLIHHLGYRNLIQDSDLQLASVKDRPLQPLVPETINAVKPARNRPVASE
jgi:hypothetical protein